MASFIFLLNFLCRPLLLLENIKNMAATLHVSIKFSSISYFHILLSWNFVAVVEATPEVAEEVDSPKN